MKMLAIFDFDGTLFDSIEDVLICFNKALALHDFPTLTREGLIPCLGGNIDEIVSLVLGDNYTLENMETVKRTYLELYNSSKKENTVPFPESHRILKELQNRGVLIAVNSNRLNYSLKYFVEKYFHDIDFVSLEGHDIDCPSKPHPHGANRIIEKAGVLAEKAVYIGDSKTDIETARNAGIDCILVRWGYGNRADWENEHILDCISEFSDILNYF